MCKRSFTNDKQVKLALLRGFLPLTETILRLCRNNQTWIKFQDLFQDLLLNTSSEWKRGRGSETSLNTQKISIQDTNYKVQKMEY